MAPKGKKKSAEKKQPWIRTGGAIGDDSMSKLEAYANDGAGVDESEESVGAEPNAKFLSGKTMARHID